MAHFLKQLHYFPYPSYSISATIRIYLVRSKSCWSGFCWENKCKWNCSCANNPHHHLFGSVAVVWLGCATGSVVDFFFQPVWISYLMGIHLTGAGQLCWFFSSWSFSFKKSWFLNLIVFYYLLDETMIQRRVAYFPWEKGVWVFRFTNIL